uniref:Uncharacterized protein n=1 Tax=Ananas comosus var. bracteatus TaxID=296719 RepID=A0A6V7NEZ4_ANACO|nr:unnamed protein product [Ananas comosus var. bracteatus]
MLRVRVGMVPASTFRILARSLRRSVGIQRNLGHWIRDFETKIQNPCLLNLDKVSLVGFNAFFAAVFWADFVILSVIGFTSSQQENRGLRRTSEGSIWIRATFFAARSCLRGGFIGFASKYILGLIELDRATLHTRLGSSPECHSGVRLCAFASVSGSAGWTCSPLRFRVGVAWVDRCCLGRHPLRTTCFYSSSHALFLPPMLQGLLFRLLLLLRRTAERRGELEPTLRVQC